MSKHFPPNFRANRFHCPHCGVYAAQHWGDMRHITYQTGKDVSDLKHCLCEHCDKYSLWHFEKMIYPDSGSAALPHEDMPDDVNADFNEARSIVSKSPRGAAALLRLALQKLMPHLGEPGKNINDDIASLVKKGMPIQIQQACDALRVIGNESVHPGEMDLKDDQETAHALFELINVIIEHRISQPKRIQELYGSLPAGKLKGIQDRDS